MESLGVVEKVEEYRARRAGMVVAPKTNEDVRICVDLTKLNKCQKRKLSIAKDRGDFGYTREK